MPQQRTMTMLVEPEPPTLVALTNCGDPSMLVSAKVTEGLLAYGFDLEPHPQLATSWQMSEDCKTLTFHLRRDVTWHDGEPFTSRDVASSLALLRAVHGRGATTFANLLEVRTPDPHTAVVVMSQPAPFLLQAFAASESPITPAHLYARGDARVNTNGAAPVGTGPFRFAEWIRGSHIRYTRNPHYWDAPKPFVDELVVRFIDDEAAKLAAIESGEIDLAPGTPVPLSAMRRLENNPRLRLVTDGYQYTNQVVRLEFNLEHAVIGRLEVRQAIAHVLDRRAIATEAWCGYAKVAANPISPDLARFHVEGLRLPELDLAAAERLLDGAGLRRDAEGVRLRLPLDYVPAGDGYRRTAESVSRALANVGIVANVRSQDFSTYIRRIYTDHDFALTVSRMNHMFDPTVGVQRVYWSRNIRPGVPFSNASHYRSREVDELFERAAVEADAAKRVRLFGAAQARIVEDLPDLTLLAPKQITIASAQVAEHTVTADGVAGNLADARLND